MFFKLTSFCLIRYNSIVVSIIFTSTFSEIILFYFMRYFPNRWTFLLILSLLIIPESCNLFKMVFSHSALNHILRNLKGWGSFGVFKITCKRNWGMVRSLPGKNPLREQFAPFYVSSIWLCQVSLWHGQGLFFCLSRYSLAQLNRGPSCSYFP